VKTACIKIADAEAVVFDFVNRGQRARS